MLRAGRSAPSSASLKDDPGQFDKNRIDDGRLRDGHADYDSLDLVASQSRTTSHMAGHRAGVVANVTNVKSVVAGHHGTRGDG